MALLEEWEETKASARSLAGSYGVSSATAWRWVRGRIKEKSCKHGGCSGPMRQGSVPCRLRRCSKERVNELNIQFLLECSAARRRYWLRRLSANLACLFVPSMRGKRDARPTAYASLMWPSLRELATLTILNLVPLPLEEVLGGRVQGDVLAHQGVPVAPNDHRGEVGRDSLCKRQPQAREKSHAPTIGPGTVRLGDCGLDVTEILEDVQEGRHGVSLAQAVFGHVHAR
jgi:hypothetical protein